MTAPKNNDSYMGNELLKREGAVHQYTSDEVTEYLKCSKDPIYFCQKYMKIRHVDRGIVAYDPYPYQNTMMSILDSNRFSIINAPRQSGKTVAVLGYLLWFVIFNDAKSVGIIANKKETAIDILGRLQFAYENLPKFLQQGIAEYNKGSMKLENQSFLIASATSGSAARSYSFSLLYVEEVAHIENYLWEDFWHSVAPTISSGKESKVILVSTPKGMNHFYKLWTDAERGKNTFIPMHVNWWEVPDRDDAWKKEIIDTFGEEHFLQEYSTEFLGSSNTLLSSGALKRLVYTDPIYEKDKLKIYENPIKTTETAEAHTYLVTVDTSEGLGKDYHVVCAWDISSSPYTLAAIYRDNDLTPMLLPDIIYKIATDYNEAFVLIEVNNPHGHEAAKTIYDDLEYENVVFCKSQGRKGQIITSGFSTKMNYGVKQSVATKRVGCSNLKSLIESNKMVVNDFNFISELTTFIAVKNSFAAEDGCNDDIVMCAVMFAWATTQQYLKDLLVMDVRVETYKNKIAAIEEDLTPFGFGDDEVDEKYNFLHDEDGTVWTMDGQTANW